ncbi:toxin-antitoxin system YwqK family antitoxin [Persicobacter sp. CCB-QB2]|uniref:toxin-antitoxin system YwqK family antitoxin n=1 Tax=Persicobacter sp. CCB-QB2 TaxID=1561025 RepID=UPI0006A981CE|nr:hypothetical protein [Persicobacter sp. CCB-QB2]
MKILLLSLLFQIQTEVTADTTYLDKQFNVCDKAHASYYRQEGLESMCEDFNLDHQIMRRGAIVDGKENGKFFYFHPNGNIKGVKYFEKGKKIGLWQWWYSNGQLKEEGHWEVVKQKNGREREQFIIKNFFDEEGNQLLSEGSGKYFAHDQEGNLIQKGQYENSKKTGIWYSYNTSGKIIKEEEF